MPSGTTPGAPRRRASRPVWRVSGPAPSRACRPGRRGRARSRGSVRPARFRSLRPAAPSPARAVAHDKGSKPSDGSSRRIISDPFIDARAMVGICCRPPERWTPGRPIRRSRSGKRPQTRSTLPIPSERVDAKSSFSHTVSSGKMRRSFGAQAMRVPFIPCAPTRVTSRLLIRTTPSNYGVSPIIERTVVDLPTPFRRLGRRPRPGPHPTRRRRGCARVHRRCGSPPPAASARPCVPPR